MSFVMSSMKTFRTFLGATHKSIPEGQATAMDGNANFLRFGSRRFRDSHDGAFHFFAATAFHLGLVAADLVLQVAAHDEIGGFYRFFLVRAAAVLLARRDEGKIILLILVSLL